MLQDRCRSSHRAAHWWMVSLLGLLCLALASCGGPSAAKTASTSTPTATVNTKGAGETFGPTPLPHATQPYAFPATWHNAPGLTQLNTADPTTYAFAPSDGRIGYVCSVSDGHLYATRDGGDNWSRLRLSVATGCVIFIDPHDASDLFVVTARAAQTSGAPDIFDLWRSRDAGANWSKLGAAPNMGMQLAWSQMAVVGARLIGALQVNQEGYLQNGLMVSDDGGATWKPFAQSVANQGYTIGGFTLIGSAIYIWTTKGTNPGGMDPQLWASGGAQPVVHPLVAPLSGQPVSTVYWRSLDGGATWSQVTMPGNTLTAIGNYTLSSTFSLVATVDQQPIYDTRIWWSADGGATWKRLPDLRGIEQGYVIGGSFDALAPDGSVFASAQHDPASPGDDAGIFRIQPGEASHAWSPLVTGGVQGWQTSQTSAGLRLWSIGAYGPDSYLKYVDVAA